MTLSEDLCSESDVSDETGEGRRKEGIQHVVMLNELWLCLEIEEYGGLRWGILLS